MQVLPARGHLSAAQCAAWLGVLTIVMVTRVVWCEATGVESLEVSYFLSSLPPNARRIGAAIRGHWSIENGLHWVLDVVFREDARRLYDRTAAENVAFLNRLALSLLRGDTGKSSHESQAQARGVVYSLPDATPWFSQHQEPRIERTAGVQRAARFFGELMHLDGVARAVRNELLHQRAADDFKYCEFLYGYKEATRGAAWSRQVRRRIWNSHAVVS